MTIDAEHASEAERRRRFLEDCNRAYQDLKSDLQAWAEEQAERQVWDSTLGDGLKDV